MLKSAVIASILFASNVLAANTHGDPCLEGQCTSGQKTCGIGNRQKLLYCGSNSIYCCISFGSTYWKLDKTCDYCCEHYKSNGPYCTDSKEQCKKDTQAAFHED